MGLRRFGDSTDRHFLLSRRLGIWFAFGILGVLTAASATGQSGKPVVSCESLASLNLPNTTITSAQTVAAGAFVIPENNVHRQSGAAGAAGGPPQAPAGMTAMFAPRPVDTKSLPAFCRVVGKLKPASDSNIKIEVWLPVSTWNKNYLGVGGGGIAGSIIYSGSPYGLIDALRLGYAAANTDAGHDSAVEGDSLKFVLGHPERLIDFAYRANHLMTVAAKAIVKAYYGAPPKYSIFAGCSLGSTQAINEAKRYPEDYEGVIAGALMTPIVHFNAAQLWPTWLIAHDPAKAIPSSKASMIHQAVLKACATPLGEHDGIVEEPDKCHFDFSTLLCKGADGPNCLTAPQVEFMKQGMAGPVNPRTGESIFMGPAIGEETELVGMAGNPHGSSLQLYTYTIKQDANWDWKTLDYDKDIALGDKVVGPLLQVAPSELKPFFDRGGKLMVYIGWNDYHNPLTTIDYYNTALKTAGSHAKDNFLLFVVPGMSHCSGGNGCDTFDKAGTVAEWLNTGKMPSQILSSKLDNESKVIRTRPLCAYPKKAVYKGSGSMDEAANFECAAPK